MPAAAGQFMVSYSGKRKTPELEPGDRVQIWSHGGRQEKFGVVVEICKNHRILVRLDGGEIIRWHKSKVTYYPDLATIKARCELVQRSRLDMKLRQELRLPRPTEHDGRIGPRKTGLEITDYVERYEMRRRGRSVQTV